MGGPPRLLTRAPSLGGALAAPPPRRCGGRRHPSSCSSGASGTGTTTAAAQLAEADGRPTAWCRLAPGYDRAADVVQMVARAAGVEVEPARRMLDLSDQLLELIESGPVHRRRRRVPARRRRRPRPVARRVRRAAAARGVGSWWPAAVRPAGLVGLVGPRRLRVIDRSDLAFTDEEASALFERRGASRAERRTVEPPPRRLGARCRRRCVHPRRGSRTSSSTSLLDQVAAADPVGGGRRSTSVPHCPTSRPSCSACSACRPTTTSSDRSSPGCR